MADHNKGCTITCTGMQQAIRLPIGTATIQIAQQQTGERSVKPNSEPLLLFRKYGALRTEELANKETGLLLRMVRATRPEHSRILYKQFQLYITEFCIVLKSIVIICTAIGITATVFFHVFLKARYLGISTAVTTKQDEDELLRNPPITGRKNWSGTTLLLRVALLYVASRLFIILAMVYLPLYIEESSVGGKQALATVPLASYLASFVAALGLKHINRSCGTKVCYLLGALTGILACIITEFAGSNTPVVYLVAVLIGGASSITMVTSLSVTAELIGPRTEHSALVYSVVTFLDKVVTGLVVILIEKLRCLDKELCPTYYRDTLSIVCAASMLVGLLALASVARCLT